MSKIAEIVGPSGRTHYRRPPGDPLVAEAERTNGYSVRYVDQETEDRTFIVSVDGYADSEFRAISRDKARAKAWRALNEATGCSFKRFLAISSIRLEASNS
ncbi:hypothetical protein [Ferrovibrio terrae]|uniref:hypothetical protein n=1 Tax=Ferrovibrio terrae TaxID=2594003 RepID=UPI0031377A75